MSFSINVHPTTYRPTAIETRSVDDHTHWLEVKFVGYSSLTIFTKTSDDAERLAYAFREVFPLEPIDVAELGAQAARFDVSELPF